MESRQLAALATLAAALAALGVALGSERWADLVPCALCLVERWPYRIAAGLGVVSLLATWLPGASGLARLLLWCALLAVLAGAAAAFVHVGVEFHWWPSPLPECAAPHLLGSIADRLRAMPVRPSKACDDPSYLIPLLPLSMAMMNLLYALAFAAGLGWYLRGKAKGDGYGR